MSLAIFQNADAVVQPIGAVVRWGESGSLCNLASASGASPLTGVLGTRLVDVAAGNSAPISPLDTGSVIRLTQTISVGQVVWLSADGSGRGTPVVSTYKLGICYAYFEIGGLPYAQIVIPHLWQEIPYDLSCYVAGQPDISSPDLALCLLHKVVRSFQLLAVDGKLAAVATADAVWELQINGVKLVELHWTTGSDAVTIVGTIPDGGASIAAGSIVSLIATIGATQPTNIAVTMKGALP